MVQDHFNTVYCFAGPEGLMAAVNPPNLHFGPQFDGEWLGAR
jgi:hypothetical protein